MREYYDGHLINHSSNTGYPTIWINGKNNLLHRYVWEKHHGKIPKGYQIHHIDGDKSNYELSNLEIIKIGDHQRIHALVNGLGKSNKGRPKRHQSGFCDAAKSVKLTKDNKEIFFLSESEAVRFLGLKSVTSITNVLHGKSKTARGWKVEAV